MMQQAMVSDRARRAYQSSAVQMQDPLGLVVQLYDGMLGFLGRGADRLAAGQKAAAAEPIRRAMDIIGELQGVLNLKQGGEVAFNLDRIYTYCRKRVMESHLRADAEGLHEVVRLLKPLRDAWVDARAKQMQLGL